LIGFLINRAGWVANTATSGLFIFIIKTYI